MRLRPFAMWKPRISRLYLTLKRWLHRLSLVALETANRLAAIAICICLLLWRRGPRLLFLAAVVVAALPGVFIVSDTWLGTKVLKELVYTRDIGECARELFVHPEQFCTYPHGDPGVIIRFRVYDEGALWHEPPELRKDFVNEQSEAVIGKGNTFQARQVGGRWKIEAAGGWVLPASIANTNGYCIGGLVLNPGEYCIDRVSGAHVRIYAVPHPQDPTSTKNGYALVDFEVTEREDLGRMSFVTKPALAGRFVFVSEFEYQEGGRRFRIERQDEHGHSWQIIRAPQVTEDQQTESYGNAGNQPVANPIEPGQGLESESPERGVQERGTTGKRGVRDLEGTVGVDAAPSAQDSAEYSERKDLLAGRLFDTDDPDGDTYHDFADFRAPRRGEPLSACDGYVGGHASWHVQTKSVAGALTVDITFFSLSEGVVIAADQGDSRGVIAVYDSAADVTTLYANVRSKFVSEGDTVHVGMPLGIQGGNPDLHGTDNELVHIEVRPGRRGILACGADGDLDGFTEGFDPIDPVDFLYERYFGPGAE